jgi:hypothetical protein
MATRLKELECRFEFPKRPDARNPGPGKMAKDYRMVLRCYGQLQRSFASKALI